jgi:hypothetical protein
VCAYAPGVAVSRHRARELAASSQLSCHQRSQQLGGHTIVVTCGVEPLQRASGMDGVDKYVDWVRQHPDNARRVEDAARLLSFIVPVRTHQPRWLHPRPP